MDELIQKQLLEKSRAVNIPFADQLVTDLEYYGFTTEDATNLAGWICDVLDNLEDSSVIENVKAKVLETCKRLPVYVD